MSQKSIIFAVAMTQYEHIYFTRLEEDYINAQIKTTSQSTHSLPKYKVKESSYPRPNNSQSNTLNDHKKAAAASMTSKGDFKLVLQPTGESIPFKQRVEALRLIPPPGKSANSKK